MPMKVLAKPEPGIEMNGELKPVAIALASIVLPVPGAPRKSRPRSRLPPAFSNASPLCQRLTTRRTSSFGSAWPRTSSSLTPQSASPGSNALICVMPISISGPKRIAKFAMNRKKTKTTWIRMLGFWTTPAMPCSSHVKVLSHVTLSPGSAVIARTANRIVMITAAQMTSRTLRDQNHQRRRSSASASRRCSESSP